MPKIIIEGAEWLDREELVSQFKDLIGLEELQKVEFETEFPTRLVATMDLRTLRKMIKGGLQLEERDLDFDPDGEPPTAEQVEAVKLLMFPFSPKRCTICEDYIYTSSEYFCDCPACDMKRLLDEEWAFMVWMLRRLPMDKLGAI